MKIDAISILERASIIRVLREQGKWEGHRLGAYVRIVRFRTISGTKIEYLVSQNTRKPSARHLCGEAQTVGAAVTAINAFIRGRVEAPTVPAAVLAKYQQREEWLPYKDA